MTDNGLLEDTLRRVSSETSLVLDHYLEHREPAHWLWDLVAEYPGRGGKAIRPALCIETCLAFDGEAHEAILSATAIELLHNAFLVHDDIQDESERRRGLPTLHEMAGVPLALNAGDAMAMEAMSLLRDNRHILGSHMTDSVLREFELTIRHTVEGQAIELGWRRDGVVDLDADDYLDLVIRKTCWYTTIHPLRVGAMIGGWHRVPLEPLTHFGVYLGAAFQIQDDLLNLVGDEAVYGKEILGDLYEGKRTLMLVHLLNAVDDDTRGAISDQFLDRPRDQHSEASVRELLDLMHRHGSLEYARAFADGIRARAFEAFEVAFALAPDSPHKRFLFEMIDFMLDRRV